MNLHNNIQNYVNELQNLLHETDEQALIDKASEVWKKDDARYEVLEQFWESEGFIKSIDSSLKLTVQMPFELQEQTQHLARQQNKTLSEIIRLALTSYLDNDQKPNQPMPPKPTIEQGRELMRQLGAGLGYGTPPHETARHHDDYLYQK